MKVKKSNDTVLLKDAIDLISGRDLTKLQYNAIGKGIPYVMGASNIKNGEFLIERWTDSPTVIGKEGDIVLSVKGTVGQFFILRESEVHLSRQVMALRVKEGYLNEYIKYFLAFYIEKLKQKAKGMIPGITREDILYAELPDFELAEQKAIINMLKIAESLIEKRKSQLLEFSSLTQSVFFDMFGDPVANSKKYPKMKIEDIALNDKGAIKSGPFGSQLLISELTQEGIPVFGIENVGVNKFIYTNNKAITPTKYEQLKSFKVKNGDVLISRTGTVGRTCVTPNIDSGIIGPNLLKISVNKEKVKPEYISHIFNYLPNIIDQIKKASPGATVAVFNTKNLKAIEILVPSIEEQVNFVDIINKVERQRGNLEKNLVHLEHNYKSLLHRAFNGELFNK